MERIRVYDLHTDLLTSNIGKAEKKKIIQKIRTDGHKACLALFLHDANDDLSVYKNYTEVAIEDLGSARYEDEIFKLNSIYISLTHNSDNKYAGGALGEGSFTDLGRKTVQRMNENGIILDLAHINRKSFFEALNDAERVMISHTCFCQVQNHKRNVGEDQIRAVIEKGGIIGLTFVSCFLTDKGKATIEDVMRHIDWFCSRFGHKNLAIGTDFFGTENGVHGIDSYDAFSLLADALDKSGYQSFQIDDIFFNNAQRFLRK